MRAFPAIWFALFLGAPSALWAVGLEFCEAYGMRGGPHFIESDFTQHPNGFVSYRAGGSFDGTGGSHLHLVSCGEARGLTIPTWSAFNGATEFDVQKDAEMRLEQVLASSTAFTLRDLETEFKKISAGTLLQPLEDQPCACAVAYPNKGRWKTRFDFKEAKKWVF